MVDVLLLAREHGPAHVELAVRGALAAGAHDGRAVGVLARRADRPPAAVIDDLPSGLSGSGLRSRRSTDYDQLLAAGACTMSVPAKVQAMETLIEAHAVELKLPTVRRRFRQLAEEATRDQQTPTAYLAALLGGRGHRTSRAPRTTAADRRPLPADQTTGGVPLPGQPEGPTSD